MYLSWAFTFRTLKSIAIEVWIWRTGDAFIKLPSRLSFERTQTVCCTSIWTWLGSFWSLYGRLAYYWQLGFLPWIHDMCPFACLFLNLVRQSFRQMQQVVFWGRWFYDVKYLINKIGVEKIFTISLKAALIRYLERRYILLNNAAEDNCVSSTYMRASVNYQIQTACQEIWIVTECDVV